MPKVSTDPQKIAALLSRGVEEVIQRDDLEKRLKSGERLRVKLGIDPTSPNIHIGRSIPLLKMRDFQELGHQLVFIVGDFTGVVGDTSDKDSERPMLQTKQVKENMKNYVKQAGKVIDMKKCEVHYNSKWLKKLNFNDICLQADQFSLAEFIARDNIRRRLDAGTRVSLRELMYPLMQGYDSVAIKADVELGGTDQRFNLLAGRTLQSAFKQRPQNILTGPIIEGTDGRKMSSSWGNTINLTDTPNDMYGKIMTIPDELIIKYFTLTTRVPLETVKQYETEMKNGANPRDYKMQLGFALVQFYFSKNDAVKAQEYFIATFKNKEKPTDIPEVKPSAYDIITVLVESKLVTSKAEARRAVEQGGVKIDDTKVDSIATEVKSGSVVQKGKRFFVKIV